MKAKFKKLGFSLSLLVIFAGVYSSSVHAVTSSQGSSTSEITESQLASLWSQLNYIQTLLTAYLSSLSVPSGTQLAQVTPTATLTLNPSSNSVTVNNTFTVNIILNTAGQTAYGADINLLRFNPSILQVVDADAGTTGVQIAQGTLMSFVITNSVNNTAGTIQFSQLATPGSTFSGIGTLATITFRAVSVGTSNVTFDFTLGSGTDTNVAGLGGDLLASVVNGSYSGTAVPDTTAPSSPGAPILSGITSTLINLTWTASTDNVGVTGYRLERCSGSTACTTYAQIATPTANLYSDTGLTASTIYRYRVRAVDAAGNLSLYSTAANATTQAPPDTTPPTISGVSISGVTVSDVTISWTTNELADTQVDYGLTTSYGNSTALNSSLVTSHSVTLSGLLAGTTYHYRVKSRDVVNNLTAPSDNTFTTQMLPDTTTPAIPSGVTATPTSETQVQLSWTASTDPIVVGQTVSGISNYQIFRNGSMISTTTSTAYLDTGLTAGATYAYQVVAVDNASNVSTRSGSVSVTTPIASLSVQRRIVLVPEGAPTNQRNITGTIEFLNPTNLSSKVYQASFITDSSGHYIMDVPAGLLSTVIFRSVISGYLSKLLSNVDLRNTSVLDATFSTLPAGDFNDDQLINSLDFSYMNSKWNLGDTLADINRDSVVNSLDFAYLSNNWLQIGE